MRAKLIAPRLAESTPAADEKKTGRPPTGGP
jgi:hypothetical protein